MRKHILVSNILQFRQIFSLFNNKVLVFKKNRAETHRKQEAEKSQESAKVIQQEIADTTGLAKNYISSIWRGVHKCNAQTFIAYAKKCGVSLDEMAGLIPKSKLNRKLVQKLSEMSENDQERALKILKLMIRT